MTVSGDLPPLAVRGWAIRSLVRCIGRSLRLLARREVCQPTDRLGELLRFDDGSHSHVYRETTLTNTPTDQPVVLVVAFRLRGVRVEATPYSAQSLLNTPLFIGFPGFRSKLWLTHDDQGRYRGFYQWDGAARGPCVCPGPVVGAGDGEPTGRRFATSSCRVSAGTSCSPTPPSWTRCRAMKREVVAARLGRETRWLIRSSWSALPARPVSRSALKAARSRRRLRSLAPQSESIRPSRALTSTPPRAASAGWA